MRVDTVGGDEGKGLKLVALHEFLVQQDDRLINELYTHPATCMSVFRELPEIAKHVIIRILFINQAIARQVGRFFDLCSSLKTISS